MQHSDQHQNNLQLEVYIYAMHIYKSWRLVIITVSWYYSTNYYCRLIPFSEELHHVLHCKFPIQMFLQDNVKPRLISLVSLWVKLSKRESVSTGRGGHMVSVLVQLNSLLLWIKCFNTLHSLEVCSSFAWQVIQNYVQNLHQCMYAIHWPTEVDLMYSHIQSHFT